MDINHSLMVNRNNEPKIASNYLSDHISSYSFHHLITFHVTLCVICDVLSYEYLSLVLHVWNYFSVSPYLHTRVSDTQFIAPHVRA